MKKLLYTLLFIACVSPIFAQVGTTISYMDNFDPVTTLSYVGIVNGKYSYSGTTSSNVLVEVEWSTANSRWEIILTCGLCSGLTFANTSDTELNPPSLTLGTWTNIPSDGTVLLTFSGSGTTSVLPVELVSFDAFIKEDAISLQWETAVEINNAGFEIQRSRDGQQFELLGFVEGKGTTFDNQFYSFDDGTISANEIYYYRLKQIDYDGQFEYSDIISGLLKSINQTPLGKFYPNPTSGNVSLEYTNTNSKNLVLTVFNDMGEVMTSIKKSPIKGTSVLDINFSSLSTGIYFVKLQAGEKVDFQKVVIE